MSRVRLSRDVHPGHGILTAVLVGSTVFSAMTLPLVMQQPVPLLMDFPPQWNQTSPARMDRETRNSIIRYLGIAIVASVGSGMGAVEMLRRQARSRRLRQSVESGLQEAMVLPDSALEPTYVPFVAAGSEPDSEFASEFASEFVSEFASEFAADHSVFESAESQGDAAAEAVSVAQSLVQGGAFCMLEAPAELALGS